MYIKIYARAYCPNLLCFFNWKTWFYIVVLILMMILFVFKLVKYRFRFESLTVNTKNESEYFNILKMMQLHFNLNQIIFSYRFCTICSFHIYFNICFVLTAPSNSEIFFRCSTKAIQKRVNLWIFFGRERLAKKEMSFI